MLPDAELTHPSVRSNGSATATEASGANDTLLKYLGELVEKRLQNPGDDLITRLVQEQVIDSQFEHLSHILSMRSLYKRIHRSNQGISARRTPSK